MVLPNTVVGSVEEAKSGVIPIEGTSAVVLQD